MKLETCEMCQIPLKFIDEFALCRTCRVYGWPEQAYYDKIMDRTRARAHQDKETIAFIENQPYTERMRSLKLRGHLIDYPPEPE